jgi:hypothetical protein
MRERDARLHDGVRIASGRRANAYAILADHRRGYHGWLSDYPQSPQKFSGRIPMHAGSLLIAATLVQTSVAFASEPMAPNDIKATFFDGKPFNAASPSAQNSQ